jgi:hypothetical protein
VTVGTPSIGWFPPFIDPRIDRRLVAASRGVAGVFAHVHRSEEEDR